MIKRELTCIGCPLGCNLEVELDGGKVIKVSGNSCKIGYEYGIKECTNPTRIVTTTVFVEGGQYPTVSVKTEKDIPKDKIFDCIAALKGITVKAPINIGDIIVSNVLNTGVNIIATKRVNAIYF
jgi:CxxC motif-containing protein